MTVQTYIFFDLETTGLPAKNNPAKITELALICVTRRDIEKADGKNLPPMSKMTMLFNPQKTISPYVSKLTGLSNKILSNQPTFQEKVICINSFLDVPKPVCLVAHNGDLFDYKIISSEYAQANATLPQDLLCIDSLKAFRKILTNENYSKPETSTLSSSNESGDSDWPNLDITPEDFDEIDNLCESFSSMTSTPKAKNTKMSYALGNIYKKLLKKQPTGAHRAELDCIMLLECVIATKHEFLPWTDKHCKLLNNIQSC